MGYIISQEVKLHRDQLIEESQTLTEANRRYRMHTSELKDRVESLAVSSLYLTSQLSIYLHAFTHFSLC